MSLLVKDLKSKDMSERNYNVNYFLTREDFQEWVNFPTAENQKYWQNFLKRHPEAASAVQEAHRLLQDLQFENTHRPESVKSRIKKNIDRAIADETLQPISPIQVEKNIGKTRSLQRNFWLKVAASVSAVLLLACAYLVYASFFSYTLYTTSFGEQQEIVLPDASIVTLNANSSLKLKPSDWKQIAERKVWLEGEAFFSVEKKKTQEGEPAKFIVHTSDVEVEVLGTQFNVNARHAATKVVLSHGKVKLKLRPDAGDSEREITMKPGDLVSINKQKKEVVRKIVETSLYTSWKENKLVFEKTPLLEIVQLLKDNYNLEVSIEDKSLREKEFTGTAPADNPQVLINKLMVVYNLKSSRYEGKIILEPR